MGHSGFGILLLFTFSCTSTVIEGRMIDSAKVKQFAKSGTSVEKVEEVFGQSNQMEGLSSGTENYIYVFYRRIPIWWTINPVDKQRLEIVIKSGLVQMHKFYGEGKEVFLKNDK